MSKVYHCEHCHRVFHGVTNRRAKRPLNSKAVAVANAHSKETCPKLTHKSRTRRITMSSDDYLCRRVWMDKYLDALEEEEPEKIEPVNKTKPEEPQKDCPLVGPIDPKMECALVSIVAVCEHKANGLRSATDGNVLEVVPTSTYGSDTIELDAQIQKSCGVHPIWRVTDHPEKVGPSHSFPATGPVVSKLWLPSIDPKVYDVSCESHHCPRSLKIHAYPPDELSVNVDLKKLLDKIRKITDVAEKVLDTIADRFQWKYLEGKVSAQAAWKEHTDHRAFYAYAIAIKLEPIFGAELKLTIGPGKITKLVGKIPWFGKYAEDVIKWLVDAGAFFKLNGGINIDVSYKRDQPEQKKFVDGTGPGLGGQLGAGVGVEGGIVGDLIRVEIEAAGSIKGSGAPFVNDKGFGLSDFTVDFDGLKGTGKLVFLWGVVDGNKTITFIGPSTLYGPEDLYFYQA